jgi:hypothetical protein
MADPQPIPTQESTNQQLQAYIQNMPGLISSTSAGAVPLAEAQQAATDATAPQQAALEQQLLAQYGPQLSSIGNTITAQSNEQQAQNNTALMQGAGGQEANAAQALQEQLDPQYYATRAAAGNQIQNLLGSINLGGLTGSEAAQVERANNQSDAQRGIANSPSQTATVSNAMNFGTALQAKQNNLENALSSATSFMNQSQGPINGFQVATGQSPSSGATTPTSFGGGSTGANAASGANSLGQSLLGGINSTATNNANITANRRDVLDRINGSVSSLPSC